MTNAKVLSENPRAVIRIFNVFRFANVAKATSGACAMKRMIIRAKRIASTPAPYANRTTVPTAAVQSCRRGFAFF